MTKNYNLDFCNKYAYPEEIKRHFEKILNVFAEIDPVSVILIGSAARGELDYEFICNNELRLYSDYEFIVIMGRRNKEKERIIREKIKRIEKEINETSGLFHIDYSFTNPIKLFLLPKTLWTYELKANGITVYGKDLQKRIPQTNIHNLDFKELNQHLIWRLWLLLLYLPKNWITGRPLSSLEKEKYKHLLCRSGLDLSVIILPWEGVMLPSFKERVNYISSNYHSLKCRKFLGDGFPNFLEDCWHCRRMKDLDSAGSFSALYKENINYYLRFLNYLLGRNNIEHIKSDIFEEVERKSFRLFKDFDFKRKFYDFFIMIKHFKSGKSKALKWFFRQKEGKILNSLFFIHLSFLNFLDGDFEKREYFLKKSLHSLNGASFRPIKINEESFSESWLNLRKQLGEFMMLYYKWINNQRKHIELNLG